MTKLLLGKGDGYNMTGVRAYSRPQLALYIYEIQVYLMRKKYLNLHNIKLTVTQFYQSLEEIFVNSI